MKPPFPRLLALATTLSLGLLGSAHALEYATLDSQASRLTFGYSQMNVKMDGSFSELKARELRFDPAHPEAATVVIEVALASIDAGYEDANSELGKAEWLALDAHPLATFTADKVTALGDDRYQVTGALSIKGVTQEVTAPFTFKQDGDAGIFDGNFTFQRADFGVGEGQWKGFGIVANDIQITFHIVAKP